MNASPIATATHFSCDLSNLVIQTSEVMACYGGDCRYVAISPALGELLHCTAADLIGKTDLELAEQRWQSLSFGESHSANLKPYWQQTAEALAIMLETGQPTQQNHSFLTSQGTRDYETIYTPIKDDRGQLQQILSISRALTYPSSQLPTDNNSNASLFVNAEMPGLETASLDNVPVSSTLSPTDHSSSKPHELEPAANRFVPKAISSEHQIAEFLQIVLDSIPQYIFWKNKAGVYLGSNQRWAEMAGFSNSDQVVGITDDDLPWTQEQKDWYRKCDLQVMETDTPMLRIKQSQRQANGQLSWRETSKFPLHDIEGNVVGLLGTIEDVTERKVAEDLLKQSAATFRNLAKRGELLNQLSTQIRQSLKLESIQQTTVSEVRQLFAVDRALIYRFDSDWNGQVVVESVAEKYSPLLSDAGISNSHFHRQYVDKYQQGEMYEIADTTASDLDAQHKDYLNNLSVKAALVVPISVENSLWGLLIVHQCSETREWKADERDLLKAIAGQVGMAIHQASLLAKARESATLAEEKAQQLKVTLHTLKQAQTQLVQTEKMSSLGQMVAGIAHEINNPVNFIHGNLKPLEGYVQDIIGLIDLYETHYPTPNEEIQEAVEEVDIEFVQEDLKKMLVSMQTGTERIREIVLSLRNFSRTDEAGCKAVDIHEGIDSTLLILQHRLKAQSERPEIVVVRDYGELPPVECYASQLNQVFMNILANAIDALEGELQDNPTTEKIPQITLRTKTHKDTITVSLADNGTGIPEAVQKQMFNPFFTTKEVGKGTGMGMAISHQIIVEKHMGKIDCLSKSGVGTEFVITIPIKLEAMGKQ